MSYTDATEYDIVLDFSTDWEARFTVADTAGYAVDVSGWTLNAEMRLARDTTGAAAATLTCESTATAGEIVVSLAAVSVTPGRYVWDLRVDEGSRERILVYGTATVGNVVTRASA